MTAGFHRPLLSTGCGATRPPEELVKWGRRCRPPGVTMVSPARLAQRSAGPCRLLESSRGWHGRDVVRTMQLPSVPAEEPLGRQEAPGAAEPESQAMRGPGSVLPLWRAWARWYS